LTTAVVERPLLAAALADALPERQPVGDSGATQLRYLLFVDETGDRGIARFDQSYPVLGLCGCIVEESVYRSVVVPALDAFKIAWFGHVGLTLHYSAIAKRSGAYAVLQTPDRMYAFERSLATLFETLPILVIAAVIDKRAYRARLAEIHERDATLPRDLYLMAADFVLERFVEVLEQQRAGAAAVVAESRGRREDAELRGHYARRREEGTQFYSAERFAMLPVEISFRTKDDRVAGLELADPLAPPIATRTIREDAERSLLWRAVRPKIWLRGDERPGGVGLKTFPDSIGREIMGVPLRRDAD